MRSWTYHLDRKSDDGVGTLYQEAPCVAARCARADAGQTAHPTLTETPSVATGGMLLGSVDNAKACMGVVVDADPPSYRPAVEGLTCCSCGKSFTSKQGLRTHVRQVHELQKYGKNWTPVPSADSSLKCAECGRLFRDAEALFQHTVAKHQGATSASSSGSSRTTVPGHGVRGPSLLLGADAEHKDITNKCGVCGMALPQGMSMDDHVKNLWPVTRLDLHCSCGRAFVDARALEQHMRFCHRTMNE